MRAEAERLGHEKTPTREEMVAQWAKLEVLAPLDGTVIERNVALGDLVDTNIDLFKIADLSRLRVVAHAYEEDLPMLDALNDEHRAWSVTVGSGQDVATRPVRFDQVGCIIDPNQHTALVMGWVDNPDGRLRVGQFVTVHLEIPPSESEVVIPAAAVVRRRRSDDGVSASRGHARIRSPPDHRLAAERRQGIPPQQAVPRRSGSSGLEPLPAGQLVVTSRIAQLTATLNGLKSTANPQPIHPGSKLNVPMIENLIRWAVHNRLIVILLASPCWATASTPFESMNVEAYPDPAPAIVEIVARYPGASAEEVERQVTIPLEVALAGMPGLNIHAHAVDVRVVPHPQPVRIWRRSAGGAARDPQPSANGAVARRRQPRRSLPQSPTGEIFRYVLAQPKDAAGRDIYDPNDLKSLQDSTLERSFRRLPRVVDVTSYGGTVKRYEIHPDPGTHAALRHHAAADQGRNRLEQFQRGRRLHHPGRRRPRGPLPGTVRARARDPIETAMGMKDPVAARDYLRAEEERRLREIRQIVLSATNNVPVRVDDVVEGGPLPGRSPLDRQGVVMG